MRVLLVLLVAVGAWAQLPVSVGLKGGTFRSEGQTNIVGGPYAELKLPFLPAVETGLMIRRWNDPLLGTRAIFDVPVLLKKRYGGGLSPLQPFVAGGGTIRLARDGQEREFGLTLAGGVTVRALLVRIEPEFRFTQFFGDGRRNQAEFLVGLRF
jgi:hypothetical protein